MKKHQKRLFGSFGLVLAAAMTLFAAYLPGPKASAVSSVTDTIMVRVVGSAPDVQINTPADKAILTEPEQTINIYRENISTATVTLTYTDEHGDEQILTIASLSPDYAAGEDNIDIDLDNYGYNDYILTVVGNGHDGAKDIDIREFSYVPLKASIVEDETTGLPYITTEYKEGVVAKWISYVYYNGELVTPSPIEIDAPETRALLDLTGKPEGVYTVKTFAYDENGNQLGKGPFVNTYYHEVTPVPDTGGLFKNLNISKEDSLITGLIAFFGFAAIALWIVVRGKRSTKK